jgi:hypothetical protein
VSSTGSVEGSTGRARKARHGAARYGQNNGVPGMKASNAAQN